MARRSRPALCVCRTRGLCRCTYVEVGRTWALQRNPAAPSPPAGTPKLADTLVCPTLSLPFPLRRSLATWCLLSLPPTAARPTRRAAARPAPGTPRTQPTRPSTRTACLCGRWVSVWMPAGTGTCALALGRVSTTAAAACLCGAWVSVEGVRAGREARRCLQTRAESLPISMGKTIPASSVPCHRPSSTCSVLSLACTPVLPLPAPMQHGTAGNVAFTRSCLAFGLPCRTAGGGCGRGVSHQR